MCIIPIGRIFVITPGDPFNRLADSDEGSLPKPFASSGLFWYKVDALIIRMQIQRW